MKLPFDFSIQHFDEVESTNSLAQDYAAHGAREGLVIVAEYQTGGRGKPGRKWVSPSGKNLLFSIVLRPPITANKAPILTQIACRSVAAVLKKFFAIDSEFKFPNDILVEGKKICGILVESQTGAGNKIENMIVGIGLNINSRAKDLLPEATSIIELTGKEHQKEEVLEEILEQLKKDIEELYAHPV